jgi:hypothetical protein
MKCFSPMLLHRPVAILITVHSSFRVGQKYSL